MMDFLPSTWVHWSGGGDDKNNTQTRYNQMEHRRMATRTQLSVQLDLFYHANAGSVLYFDVFLNILYSDVK